MSSVECAVRKFMVNLCLETRHNSVSLTKKIGVIFDRYKSKSNSSEKFWYRHKIPNFIKSVEQFQNRSLRSSSLTNIARTCVFTSCIFCKECVPTCFCFVTLLYIMFTQFSSLFWDRYDFWGKFVCTKFPILLLTSNSTQTLQNLHTIIYISTCHLLPITFSYLES